MTRSGERSHALSAVAAQLDQARLIWCGVRGEDGQALAELSGFVGSVSIIASPRANGRTMEVDVCLEDLRGVRPDLDRYNVDLDPSEAAREFRRRMIEAVGSRCVVVTYRPSALVTALSFPMAETMTLCGPASFRQAAFEHKPWVERSLRARGVRGIPWRYLADEQHDLARSMLTGGPHVLRASHTSGGVGMSLAREAEDIERCWPTQPDGFIALAPFQPGVPINFSGCVFADGSIRLHPASVQLIGIPLCTSRTFGYCGNDFGAFAECCDAAVADGVQELGRIVGRWLYEEGYRGAYGVDAILARDGVVFAEVNPRFQGSSPLSALIARELGLSDLYLDHIAAMTGLPPAGPGLTIGEWAKLQPSVSRVVLHNTQETRLRRTNVPALGAEAEVAQLSGSVAVEPGGTLGCLTMRRSVTSTGMELDAETERLIRTLQGAYREALAR